VELIVVNLCFKILTKIKGFFDKLRYSKGHGGILARGAIGVFILKIAGTAFLFGLHVLLARLLGVRQYGIYVYAITWLNILVILCLLGFQTSLVRFIAEYKIKHQWSLLRGLLRRSEQIVLGFTIAVSLSGMIFLWAMCDRLVGEITVTFYIAFFALPFMSFYQLRAASLRALKHVFRAELLLCIIRPVLMSFIVICLFFFVGDSYKAGHAMVADLAAVISVSVTGAVFLHKLLPKAVFRTQPDFENTQWLKVSLPLLFVAGMHIILKRTDIIMVGAILNPDSAGVYSAASRISDLVVFGLVAINSILAPIIAELYHTGQQKQLQKIISLAARAIFVFTLTTSAILAVSGKHLLLFFGLEFVSAFTPLLILLFSQTVNALAGPVGYIMTMTGHQKQAGAIITISAAVNVILNFFFIRLLGLIGAAISTTFTMIFWNTAMFIYVRQKIGISPSITKISKAI